MSANLFTVENLFPDTMEDVPMPAKEPTSEASEAPKQKRQRSAKPKTTHAPSSVEPSGVPQETPVAAPKPSYSGFEVKDASYVEPLKALTESTSSAIDAIANRDADLLQSYLVLGEFQSKAAPMFSAPRVYGEFLAKELPASQKLDPALRTNCKWLWEALNLPGHDASDILSVLGGINDISSFRSQNPTVIRREYRTIKDKAVKLAQAREAGIEEDDEDAAVKAVSKQEKNRKKELQEQVISDMLRGVQRSLDSAKARKKTYEEALALLQEAIKAPELFAAKMSALGQDTDDSDDEE